MALWRKQLVGRPVPASLAPKWIRASLPAPGRTFLAACVDEAREDPWDAARLHRELVEQELKAIRQALVETSGCARAASKPRSLAKRNILQVLEAMPPGDLGSLQKEVLIEKVTAEIDAKYDGVGRARSTIQPVLGNFLKSRLLRQAPARVVRGQMRTKTQ
jgi:hypothetical protein